MILTKGLNTFKFILIITSVSILTSCDKDDDNDNNTPQYSIIGEWLFSAGTNNHTYTFNPDGSFTDILVYDPPVTEGWFTSRTTQGTYLIKGDTLLVHVTSNDHPDIEPGDLPYDYIDFFKLGSDYKGEYIMFLNSPDNGVYIKFYRK